MRIASIARRAAGSWQRTAGGVLIVFGSLALLTAATGAARGAIARDDARSRWAEREAERAVTGGRRMAEGDRRAVIARGEPVARLAAPRIGLDEIVVEGVGD